MFDFVTTLGQRFDLGSFSWFDGSWLRVTILQEAFRHVCTFFLNDAFLKIWFLGLRYFFRHDEISITSDCVHYSRRELMMTQRAHSTTQQPTCRKWTTMMMSSPCWWKGVHCMFSFDGCHVRFLVSTKDGTLLARTIYHTRSRRWWESWTSSLSSLSWLSVSPARPLFLPGAAMVLVETTNFFYILFNLQACQLSKR